MRLTGMYMAMYMVLAACGGPPSAAKDAVSAEPSAEAAVVNGQVIYVSDVQLEARAKGLTKEGEQLEVESAEFNDILEQLIDVKVMAMEAMGRGLDEEPMARHRLATARDNILSNILRDAVADERIDEPAVRKMYEAQVALLTPQLDDEAHVRHILAPTKDAIDKIAADLKGGADFAVVASKRSSDEATRMDGGDLGYMAADEATPEFAKVIRDTANGSISKPFEDQMGWHIVKIDERRKQQPPSIEELREPIVRHLRAVQLEDLLKQLRSEAEIEKKTSPRNSRLDVPEQQPTKVTPAPAKPPGFDAQAPAGPVADSRAAPATTPAATVATPPVATTPAAPAPKPVAPATQPPPAPKPATTAPAPAGPVSESRPGSTQ